MNGNKKLQKILILMLLFHLIAANIIVRGSDGATADLEKHSLPEQSITSLWDPSLRLNDLFHGRIPQQMAPSDPLAGLQKSCMEPPVILWNKTYGGDESDSGQIIKKTTDNGYVIIGSTSSFGESNTDFWLLKTNADGNEVWNHTYGIYLNEYGIDVQQTSDGGYILVGYCLFFQSHNQGIRVVKTDANGIEHWNKTFGDEYHPASAFSVYQMSDGGYLIFGSNWTNASNLYLIKTDGSGNILWEKHVACPGMLFASAKTNDGGFILTGLVETTYDSDLYLMKIDANYNNQWDIAIGGDFADIGLSVLQTQDNQYVAVGIGNAVDGFEDGDVFLVQVDAWGNEEWNKTIGGNDTEIGWSVKETQDGYVIVGANGSYDSNNLDLLFIHTNKQGLADEIWSLGGDSYDEGLYVLVTTEGDYLITGYTMSFGTGGAADLWLLKIQGFQQNYPPYAPTIGGPHCGKINTEYTFSLGEITDPEGDQIYCFWDWGDGTTSSWLGPYNSGQSIQATHTWTGPGTYTIKVKLKDSFGAESPWSESFTMYIASKVLLVGFIKSVVNQSEGCTIYNMYYVGILKINPILLVIYRSVEVLVLMGEFQGMMAPRFIAGRVFALVLN